MAQTTTEKPAEKTIAVNRKAFHDYAIDRSYEAGLVLTGTEIKSIRAGRVNLREAYGRVENGEAWLYGMHVAPYEAGNRFNVEPTRRRKLLLHRKQLGELGNAVKAKGYTLVPTRLYIRNDVAKVSLALARGKREYDKREAIAKRELSREIERGMRERARRAKSRV